ncbi:ABC transporter permease subunit [bacterium]|nr:ABC transporter permease subunit [bacterium]
MIWLKDRPPFRGGFKLVDLLVICGVFLLLFAAVRLGEGMAVPFSETHQPPIELGLAALPYYAGRSLLRMFLALGASLVFTLLYGYVAAYHRWARVVLLPLLDILQSVPVLGFLSVTVVAFMALFPGSLLGLELASIFAIFTAMAWNMTFSFYYSLRTVPKELNEAAAIYQFGGWQRFVQLEVPFAMIGLVWNGMMSFGGGWFFLAASEAITVLHKNIKLPGLGSYLATAIEQGKLGAVWAAIITMLVLILAVDFFVWRPLIAWSQKFKFEQTEAGLTPQSPVLTMLQRSTLVEVWSERVWQPLRERFFLALVRLNRLLAAPTTKGDAWVWLRRLSGLGILALVGWGLVKGWGLLMGLVATLSPGMVLQAIALGSLTMLRVLVIVVLATLIWTPVGVWIGFNPKVARVAQPVVQVLASFPAVMLFPLITLCFLRFHISLDYGGILLMALGSQWYILFNVIAGAMAIPSDLREAAAVFNLRGALRWWRLIIPGIFPFWVTGAVTAAGGAWNASIVAEVVSWNGQTLTAHGLGAYIARATTQGDWSAIALGIAVMALFVVGFNHLIWRPLYDLAERKYRLDI